MKLKKKKKFQKQTLESEDFYILVKKNSKKLEYFKKTNQ